MSRPSKPRSSAGKQRRPNSPARKKGRISFGGNRNMAHRLADALRAAQQDEVVAESLTHPLHTYPARMHPATARVLLELCFEEQRVSPKTVFDPFCGSGTTLVEARALGLKAFGSDLNPLAVRIARAKTWSANKDRRNKLRKMGQQIAALTLEEGKAARRADYEAKPWRVPKGIDKQARDEEVSPWFAPHVRRELEFMASRIDELREKDGELADLLAVCLSAILIKCSKRSSDTSSKLIKRNIARGAPARWFGERVELLCEGLFDLEGLAQGQTATVLESDARDLKKLVHQKDAPFQARTIGAIISSPPYAGTYDYVEHHRLRLAFLGMPFEHFERSEIGARRRFKQGRAHHEMQRVFKDFRKTMEGAHEALADRGLMALMVGDSVAGVEPVWADGVVREVSDGLFDLVAWAAQERIKLGGLEKRAFADYPKREHILLLRKR